MPGNAAFITTNAAILPGLFTTTMAMVGDFGVDDYENPLSIAVFLIFLFIMIIVMCTCICPKICAVVPGFHELG